MVRLVRKYEHRYDWASGPPVSCQRLMDQSGTLTLNGTIGNGQLVEGDCISL